MRVKNKQELLANSKSAKVKKNCITCNKKISEGYTWENEENFVCDEKCLQATGITDSEMNSDINAGVVYWKVIDKK